MKDAERSCACKIRYTRAEANNVLKEMRAHAARTGNHKHHMNAYRCEFCGGDTWHVGHTSPPKRTHYKRIKRFTVREERESEI